MIKANELRIGNYVYHKFDELEFNIVQGFDFENVYLQNITFDYVEYQDIQPIPLTEEWLLNMGFASLGYTCILTGFKETFPYSIKISDKESIDVEFDFSICLVRNEDDFISIGNILYNSVHKLQNLYFALTGEELTIKN